MKRAIGAQAPDRLAVERWIDEGGRLAPEAVIEREAAAYDEASLGMAVERPLALQPEIPAEAE